MSNDDEIKNLRHALVMAEGLSASIAEQTRRLRQELDDAKRIAGHMSILFPATEIQGGAKPRDRVNLSVQSHFSPYGDRHQYDGPRTVSLDVMLARVDRDALDRATHVKVQFGDKSWGYAVSKEAIYSTPEDYLVRQVTEQLGFQIGRDLQREKV